MVFMERRFDTRRRERHSFYLTALVSPSSLKRKSNTLSIVSAWLRGFYEHQNVAFVACCFGSNVE